MIKNEWVSYIDRSPECDGDYYVYISNLQTGNEMRITSYKDNKWNCVLENEEIIIAWKKVKERQIKNGSKWIENHKKEIQQVFSIHKVNVNDFAIAESLEECICKYNSWFYYKQIHKINDVYVIRVIF